MHERTHRRGRLDRVLRLRARRCEIARAAEELRDDVAREGERSPMQAALRAGAEVVGRERARTSGSAMDEPRAISAIVRFDV